MDEGKVSVPQQLNAFIKTISGVTTLISWTIFGFATMSYTTNIDIN